MNDFQSAGAALDRDPDDRPALYAFGVGLLEDGAPGAAFSYFDRLRALDDHPQAWNGMGRCLDFMGRHDDALDCFVRAVEITPDDPTVLNNVGLMLMKLGERGQARAVIEKALEIDPDSLSAGENLGLLLLGEGEWETAWGLADIGVGRNPDRRERTYSGEGKWSGPEENKDILGSYSAGDLVVTGEQGVGDEVFFAACLPDLLALRSDVVIESHPKLEGLFKRSFPGVEVHGTRYDAATWAEGRLFEAHINIGELPSFFRKSPKDCPKTPYLVADPDRRAAVRGLLDSLPGDKKVGIAWTGGRIENGSPERRVDVADLVSVFPENVDLISLEYREPVFDSAIITSSGVFSPEDRVSHWPWLTESDDYDDVAALVAELDAVVAVPTSVVNLAGALGTPCHVLLPDTYHHWRYGAPGREHWWCDSLTVVRQEDGAWPLKSVVSEILDGAE